MKQRHKFVPLNRVIIAGHCTHDTQMRLTKDDVPCCDFQIGVTTNLQAGKRKHAFIQIACFGDLAQSVRRLRKGVPVIVEGELRDQMIKSAGGQWYRRLKILAHHVYRMTEEEPEEILDVFRPAEKRVRKPAGAVKPADDAE